MLASDFDVSLAEAGLNIRSRFELLKQWSEDATINSRNEGRRVRFTVNFSQTAEGRDMAAENHPSIRAYLFAFRKAHQTTVTVILSHFSHQHGLSYVSALASPIR